MVKERMDLLELLRKGGMDGDVDFLREALRVLATSARFFRFGRRLRPHLMHITPTESLSSYSSTGALISLSPYGYLSRWGLGSRLPSGQMQLSPGRAPHLGHGLESASWVRSAAGQYRQVAPAEIKKRPLRSLTKCVTVSFFMPSSWSIYISPGVNVTSALCEVLSCTARH